MAIFVNDATVWKEVEALYANDTGTWKEVQAGYVNDAATWKQMFTAPPPPAPTPPGTPDYFTSCNSLTYDVDYYTVTVNSTDIISAPGGINGWCYTKNPDTSSTGRNIPHIISQHAQKNTSFFSYWIYVDPTLVTSPAISSLISGHGLTLNINVYTNYISYKLKGQGATSGTSVEYNIFNTAQWYHIYAVTYESSNELYWCADIYVNGVDKGTSYLGMENPPYPPMIVTFLAYSESQGLTKMDQLTVYEEGNGATLSGLYNSGSGFS